MPSYFHGTHVLEGGLRTYCSLTGSSVHGVSPGKNTGVGCHALLQGIFPHPRTEPVCLISPALAGQFSTTRATWEAQR